MKTSYCRFSLLFSTFIIGSLAHAAPPPRSAPTLKLEANRPVTILLPADAIPSETTAAQEVQHYLEAITGVKGDIVAEKAGAAAAPDGVGTLISVGPTAFAKAQLGTREFGDEEWCVETHNGALVLDGSRPRGTLYAAYHFLEDECGVHWWNPWEESVPQQKVISLGDLKLHGQPTFHYRDVFGTYGNDSGRFAARNRLDRQGDPPMAAAYGGSTDYGPPYSVHTFYRIFSPLKYYKDHPDWFVGNGNMPPTTGNSQLAMSNPDMRREFLRVLLENIRAAYEANLAKHLPPPDLFDVSQNDNAVSFVGPGDAALLKANGGAESAILLDFINYLADGVKTEFPNVKIDTLAYLSGEKAPSAMKARDNVVVRLTDTHSNVLLPVTTERNKFLRDNIVQWSAVCQKLRIWDYDITFFNPHLPTPTLATYQPDLQFFLHHGVDGFFIEFEEPIMADMRDLKFWMLCKLLENPDRDYDALIHQFTDGFYGAGGPYVRQFLQLLQSAADKSGADVNWMAGVPRFSYLTPDFLKRADDLFAQATVAVKDDPILLKRVRNARSSVDVAILRCYSDIMLKWVQNGGDPAAMPLDRDAIGKRYLQTIDEQIEMRIPGDKRAAQHAAAANQVADLTRGPLYTPVPEKFLALPRDQIFTYTAHDERTYKDTAKIVEDPAAESKVAARLEVPDADLAKYHLPMPWGIYDTIGAKTLTRSLTAPDIVGPGYHWYKLDDITLTGHDYLYFCWSWYMQFDLNNAYDPQRPNAKYEIWADVKFEGPAFPFGTDKEKNAISVERVVAVRKTGNP